MWANVIKMSTRHSELFCLNDNSYSLQARFCSEYFTNIHLTFITTLRGKDISKSIMLWKRKRKQREINVSKATQQASSGWICRPRQSALCSRMALCWWICVVMAYFHLKHTHKKGKKQTIYLQHLRSSRINIPEALLPKYKAGASHSSGSQERKCSFFIPLSCVNDPGVMFSCCCVAVCPSYLSPKEDKKFKFILNLNCVRVDCQECSQSTVPVTARFPMLHCEGLLRYCWVFEESPHLTSAHLCVPFSVLSPMLGVRGR